MMNPTAPKKKPSPSHDRYATAGDNRIFFVVICLLLTGLAAPLLIVFLIKSPQPDQHFLILGVSFHKLVYLFLFSSALLVHTSLFFLRARTTAILLVFLLSLFCCFPFIVGLRNDLTLQQVILDIPFFSNWPYFLKPGYLLIQLLIPMGILIYIYLLATCFFSKKPYGYAYLGAAIFLSVAAVLGFSALVETGQPNIVTVLTRQMGNRTVLKDDSVREANPHGVEVVRFPIPNIPDETDQTETASATQPPAATNPAPTEPVVSIDVEKSMEKKMQMLTQKVDNVLVELDKIKEFFTTQQNTLKKNVAIHEKETEAPLSNKTPIVDLQQEIQRLSDKVDRISDALSQMAQLLPDRPEKLPPDASTP